LEIINQKITLIGTGRLAHSLAYHLTKNGFKIISVTGRSSKSASDFAGKYKLKSFSSSTAEFPEESNIILLAVPDNKISAAAEKIAAENKNLKGKLFIHFSGTESTEILASLRKKKALTASFHIMQTFPSNKIVSIKNCYAAVETSDEKLLLSLFNFAKQLNLIPFRINKADKVLYHITGVFTANMLASHFYNAVKTFKHLNIESPQYFEIFNSIISETIKNIKTGGFKDSLSGPVVRNDIDTIRKHVELLKKKKEKLLLINYLAESLTLIEIAAGENGKEKGFKPLKNYLTKEFNKTFLK
jgi:predicted short-subunit dehydrogenase-like oxidoreductase (DUF2520 family)